MESGRLAWLAPDWTGELWKELMARMAAAGSGRESRSGQSPDAGEVASFSLDPDDPGPGLSYARRIRISIIEPDLEDNKSGQIKLAQIRKLIAFMGHKPARDGWRVAIIVPWMTSIVMAQTPF